MSTIGTLQAAANLCESHGISIADLVALEFVDGLQPITLSNLGRAMHITSAAATGRADSLEQKGLAIRIRRKEDRRVIDLVLTKEGRGVLDDFSIAANYDPKNQ